LRQGRPRDVKCPLNALIYLASNLDPVKLVTLTTTKSAITTIIPHQYHFRVFTDYIGPINPSSPPSASTTTSSLPSAPLRYLLSFVSCGTGRLIKASYSSFFISSIKFSAVSPSLSAISSAVLAKNLACFFFFSLISTRIVAF
jgi:hypothetical protein